MGGVTFLKGAPFESKQ